MKNIMSQDFFFIQISHLPLAKRRQFRGCVTVPDGVVIAALFQEVLGLEKVLSVSKASKNESYVLINSKRPSQKSRREGCPIVACAHTARYTTMGGEGPAR